MTAPLISRKTDNIASGATPTLLLQSSEITPAMAERAKRVVAANAHSVDDARTVLQMLGLIETPRRKPEPAPPKPEPVVEPPTLEEITSTAEWIETATGSFPVCAGTCGRPVRMKTEPPAPGVMVVNAIGMCGACYDAHRERTKARISESERSES